MDATFLQARITATQAQIILYEDAISAMGEQNTQSYNLDTGQSIIKVTRFNLVEIQKTLDTLVNRLVIYEARLTGNNVSHVIPCW